MVVGADVLRGNGVEVLGIVVVTGVRSVVACTATGGDLGTWGKVVGCSDSVGVAAGVSVASGGGGSDVTTDGFVGGASTADGADGAAASEGVCRRVVGMSSGVRVRCGTSLTGLGGLTGVVDGPVAGSANAGEIPPVMAVNEMAVPAASATTNPRPRQVRLIGS